MAGAQAARRVDRVTALMREAGLGDVEVVTDDDELWDRQRAAQRSETGVVIPTTDAEAFIRGSAEAGVLRIMQ